MNDLQEKIDALLDEFPNKQLNDFKLIRAFIKIRSGFDRKYLIETYGLRYETFARICKGRLAVAFEQVEVETVISNRRNQTPIKHYNLPLNNIAQFIEAVRKEYIR